MLIDFYILIQVCLFSFLLLEVLQLYDGVLLVITTITELDLEERYMFAYVCMLAKASKSTVGRLIRIRIRI